MGKYLCFLSLFSLFNHIINNYYMKCLQHQYGEEGQSVGVPSTFPDTPCLYTGRQFPPSQQGLYNCKHVPTASLGYTHHCELLNSQVRNEA